MTTVKTPFRNVYRCPLDRRWELITSPRLYAVLTYDGRFIHQLNRYQAALRLSWWRAMATCGGAK